MLMPRPKPKHKRRRDVLTTQEIDALLAAAPHKSWTDRRTRVMIRLLSQTALRVTHARHVRPQDLRLEGDQPLVFGVGSGECDCETCRTGGNWMKNGYEADTNLAPETVREIQAFLPVRAAKLGHPAPDRPLCCTASGQVWSRKGIDERLKSLAKAANIHKQVSAHALRRSFGFNAAAAGWPVGLIRHHLHHKSLAHTVRYLGEDQATATIATLLGCKAEPDAVWQERANRAWNATKQQHRNAFEACRNLLDIITGRDKTLNSNAATG